MTTTTTMMMIINISCSDWKILSQKWCHGAAVNLGADFGMGRNKSGLKKALFFFFLHKPIKRRIN